MSVKRYEPNVYEVLGGQYECEMSEDDHGDYVLHSDYAALLARHNALREAEKTISECLQDTAFRAGVNAGWNAALLPTDLEACAKKAELLADPCNRLATLKAARAEVDRLIANESAADCKGEG